MSTSRRRQWWRYAVYRDAAPIRDSSEDAGTVEALNSDEALDRVAKDEGLSRRQASRWMHWQYGGMFVGTNDASETVTVLVVVGDPKKD